MTATGCSGPDRPPLPPFVGTVIAVTAAAVLVRLGHGPLTAPPWPGLANPEAWTRDRAAAEAVVAAIRVLALATSLHLSVTGALATIGTALRRPGLVEAARRGTPPPFRSVLGRLGGLALSAGTLVTVSSPNASAVPPAGPAVALLRQVPPPARPAPPLAPSTATLRLRPAPSGDAAVPSAPGTDETGDAQPTTAAPPATLAPPAGSLHRVVPGDHLWALAEEEVSSRLGRPATDGEVAPYWARVVAANRQLADPDLLFPGDVVTLPPLA